MLQSEPLSEHHDHLLLFTEGLRAMPACFQGKGNQTILQAVSGIFHKLTEKKKTCSFFKDISISLQSKTVSSSTTQACTRFCERQDCPQGAFGRENKNKTSTLLGTNYYRDSQEEGPYLYTHCGKRKSFLGKVGSHIWGRGRWDLISGGGDDV